MAARIVFINEKVQHSGILNDIVIWFGLLCSPAYSPRNFNLFSFCAIYLGGVNKNVSTNARITKL